MTDKITIERETLERLVRWIGGSRAIIETDLFNDLRAALAAQPAEPVAWMKTTPRTTYLRTAECMADTPEECDGLNRYGWTPLYAAPPAPVPPEPIAEMDAVAIKYAHKMALDLECILAEYGGSWYNTAMQTLGEYRSAMNAIHERESPTFMGEPVTAAGGKP